MKRIVRGRLAGRQDTDTRHFAGRLLCLGQRRKKKTDSENDREPDPPHRHLSEMAGGSLAEDGCSQELAAWVEHGAIGSAKGPLDTENARCWLGARQPHVVVHCP